MYAIIESCGKQYKVAEGDVVFFYTNIYYTKIEINSSFFDKKMKKLLLVMFF